MDDLFQIAEDNSKHLDHRFSRLVRDPSQASDLLRAFAGEVAAKGRVAVNMRPWIAADLVEHDRYYNVHQSVSEAASVSGRTVEEMLRERLGVYFTRRIGFDAQFVDGRRFHYGALNIGGAGTRRFGTICVVMIAGFPEPAGRVAYLKTDSLNGYTDAAGKVDMAGLVGEIATASHRHYLAALKHAHEIRSRRDAWPRMLCAEAQYVEAVFIAELRLSSVSQIRITREDFRILWELCFQAHGGTPSEGDRALAHDFLVLLRAQRANRIELCEVPDA